MIGFRRPRSRARRIGAVIAALFMAFVGWFAFEAWRYTGQTVNVAVDYSAAYRAILLERTQIDPAQAERAWSLLTETASAVDSLLKEHSRELNEANTQRRGEIDLLQADFTRIGKGDVLPAGSEREIEALRRIEATDTLARMDEFVAHAPGLKPLETNSDAYLINSVLSDLRPIRDLAKALVARMRLKGLAGDSAESARSFRQCLAIAQTMALQPGVLGILAGSSIHSLATDEVRHLLTENLLDEAACLDVLQSLEEFPLRDVQLSLQGERCCFLDTIQRTFTDDGSGDGHMVQDSADSLLGFSGKVSPQSPLNRLLGRVQHASRLETQQAFQQFLEGAEQEVSSPLCRRWNQFDSDVFVDELDKQNMLVAVMVPGIRKTLDQIAVVAMKGDATRLMIAIHLHRLRTGQYPSSIDAIDAAVVSPTPQDVVSGKPFGYHVVEDASSGPYFVLYSFAIDGTDDNGKTHDDPEKRLQVLTNRKLTGMDFVVNHARPAVND